MEPDHTMTIAQTIALLQQLPPDYCFCVPEYEGGTTWERADRLLVDDTNREVCPFPSYQLAYTSVEKQGGERELVP